MSELGPTITKLEPTATECLRALLDERGVEYRWDNGTATWYVDGVMYNAWGRDNERLTMSVCHLTPEQAIAATLGADAKPTQAESSGTLTAEKVRELMEENSRQYPSPTDPYVWLTEYDWQAIADELNDTLGSFNCSNSERTGMCYADETDTWECVCDGIGHYGERVTVHVMECSECGRTYEHVNGDYEYCPRCGRGVVDDG